jgi:hypothetical protein
MTYPCLNESRPEGALALTLAPRPAGSKVVDGIGGWYRPALQELSDRQRQRYAQGVTILGRRPTYSDDTVDEQGKIGLILSGIAATLCLGVLVLVAVVLA